MLELTAVPINSSQYQSNLSATTAEELGEFAQLPLPWDDRTRERQWKKS